MSTWCPFSRAFDPELSPNSGETSLGTNYSTPSDTRLPVNDDETNLSSTVHILHTFPQGDPEEYETESDSTGTSIIFYFFYIISYL